MNSMLCIQEELEQMSVVQASSAPPCSGAVYQDGTAPGPMSGALPPGADTSDSSPDTTQQPMNSKQNGWIHGIFGCLRPVLSIIGKATNNEIKGNQQGIYSQLFQLERIVIYD